MKLNWVLVSAKLLINPPTQKKPKEKESSSPSYHLGTNALKIFHALESILFQNLCRKFRGTVYCQQFHQLQNKCWQVIVHLNINRWMYLFKHAPNE